MRYVVDIDGTIADITHRLHFIQQEKKDWEAFHHACSEDAPIPEMLDLLWELNRDIEIVYVSGRTDSVREKTEAWLWQHAPFHSGELYMRKSGDYRPDYQVKEEILMSKLGGPESIDLAIDDRTQVVQMWRRHGIRTLQCADGDY